MTWGKIVKIKHNEQSVDAKACKLCKIIKPLSEFHKFKSCLGGVRPECKKCRNENARKHKDRERASVHRKLINEELTEVKRCTRCNIEKPLTEFSCDKKGVAGRMAKCKECIRSYEIENKDQIKKQKRKYRKENNEYFLNYFRQYRSIEENRQKRREDNRIYKKMNPEIGKVQSNRRKARKISLIDNLTNEEWFGVLEIFNYECSLSVSDNISIDHFIPLSLGHGGTYVGNVYPLDRWLNTSKNNRNPFQWVEDKIIRSKVDKNKWEVLIEYLAKENNLSIDEFEEYVCWCFENPRTQEEIEAGGQITSIELWKGSK